MFHSRNSLSDSGPWKKSVNSFQTKCLIIPDNEFQTKCYINSQNPFQAKCLIKSKYFSSNIGYTLKKTTADCNIRLLHYHISQETE